MSETHLLTRKYLEGDILSATDLNDMVAAINKALIGGGEGGVNPDLLVEYVDNTVDNKIANLIGSAPETLDTLGELADALENNKDSIDALAAVVDKKVNDFSIEIYNGLSGNPRAIQFATINYANCTTESGVMIKISMVSGHGGGHAYIFLQDVIIKIFYNETTPTEPGIVFVDNYKYYGAEAGTVDGINRKYGDIFWVHDTANKTVYFYCLGGQFSRVNMTPYKRLISGGRGVIEQHSTLISYENGTKAWANNDEIALLNDINLAVRDKITETRAQELINAAVGGQSTETWTLIINGEEISKNVVVMKS